MKVNQFILPSVVLGGAALLLLPATTNALVGGPSLLQPGQRDFRVFNNFTDPEANDNVTPDPNFPGYTGATLAIWKACTEWGSELHAGTGDGDPHQPGGLGSGGANFDAVFQGLATDVGDTNGNTFSELSGSASGTLGFTETPINDGWRIRFYSIHTWDDDPGTGTFDFDLQGVAATLYGFAMGFDPSNVSGATLNGTINGSGVTQRSLAAFDIASVQGKYGVVAAAKPHITGLSFSGGQLTIQGSNFAPNSTNGVWFTPALPTDDGAPVRVGSLPSNGTQITLGVPGAAGSGIILVVKGTGAPSASEVSNAWPIDEANFRVPGTAYCFGDGSLPTPCPCAPPDIVPNPSGAPDSGCANSFDLDGAKLTAAGGLSPDSIVFTGVIGGNSAAFALLLKGNASDANGVANGDGVRCVDGQLIRFGSHYAGTNGAPLGTWTYPNSAQTLPVSMATLQSPGQSAYYQLFYRNNAPGFCSPATTNMSNGWQLDW